MGSGSVVDKQKKRVKHTKSKYFTPGALAWIRYNRSSSRDIGRKRILNVKDELEVPPPCDSSLQNNTSVLPPARLKFDPFGSIKGHILPKIGKTPVKAAFEGDSGLGSLPLDLLRSRLYATCIMTR